MELIWNESPQNRIVGFSRDMYDKYTLAPNIKELWAIARSPAGTVDAKNENPSETTAVKEEPLPTNTKDRVDRDDYPEPRVPFPRLSSLTSKEQMLYLRTLMYVNQKYSFPHLQERVKVEVAEFMKYLQDVAQLCAEDYNYLCEGAARYTEEYLRCCIGRVKSYPQLYFIHEMTSLTGGKFNPDLSLSFEKQLLALGKVKTVGVKKLQKDSQLAVDYDTVASEIPPEKKANQTHGDVSCDPNADRLCKRYQPHVCLTSAALLRLLDNHGPEYSEAWDLPVWVKTSEEGENSSKKVVYVDSPLVKTEITQRERNTLFHEESVKLALKKMFSKKALELTLEMPDSVPLDGKCQRSLVSLSDTSIDFEADFTDLETFGETSNPSKSVESPRSPSSSLAEPKRGSSLAHQKGKSETRKEIPAHAKTSLVAKEEDNSWTDLESSTVDCSEKTELSASDSGPDTLPVAKQPRLDGASDRRPSESDSEEGCLVIDHSPSGFPPSETSVPPEPIPETPSSPSTKLDGKSKSRPAAQVSPMAAKRTVIKPNCDQLGRILRMQSALLKPSSTQASEPTSPPLAAPVIPPSQSHPQSLVKPCVTSYLEAKESPSWGDSPAATAAPTAAPARLMSEDLLEMVENEQDYKAPEDGNLVYTMYSLQDLLLLVRSSVQLAHHIKIGKGPQKTVPVHIMPKLEYQVCYGVECFTKSEVCQLWAEKLLHSSTSSYVGHINALTSKLFLIEEFTSDRIKKVACEFRPSKSLNVLHHLLKKLVGLQEGRYLLSHKAGEPIVTVAKASDGRKTQQGMYNLHQVYRDLPQAPPHGAVPWVPVDPSHVLSFHITHGRVPCTFPPRVSKPAHVPARGPAKGNRSSQKRRQKLKKAGGQGGQGQAPA